MQRLRLLPRAALAACALTLVAAAPAAAGTLSFSAPQLLPHGDPNGTPYLQGGEPSITFDPSGDGHAYVTAPQGIPAALGSNGRGVAYWASDDHGSSWPRSGLTGTLNGGGDSDVEVLQDHSVLVADLEAADAAICISHDFAATFPNCDNGITSNHQGPENDREWLTRGIHPGEVFLTYHDFAAGYPIIEKSTDGGQTFTPCANIVDPTNSDVTYTPQGGTLVSKPVVGHDGTVYIEFTTPDRTASPVGAPLNHLYSAALPQGNCVTGSLTDHVIYTNPGADLARIFQATAIDGSGELYVLAGGYKDAGDSSAGVTNLYLFTSTDGGAHWSAPIKVNPPDLRANVFPAIAGGPARGEAVLGWYATSTSGDPNNGQDQWQFYAATTYDGGGSFNYDRVSGVLHYGDICTSGIFCGTGLPGTGQNRNLADFASAAIDPANGCAALAIPGDPYNRPDQPNGANNGTSSAYVSLQTPSQGSCLTKANAGQPAGAVGHGAPSRCLDRRAPRSRLFFIPATRRGMRIRATATDRGCGAKGAGKVARVRVAVAYLTHRRCRFLSTNGRLGRAVSCRKPRWLRTRGGPRLNVVTHRRLPRGTYRVWIDSIDTAGNVERTRITRTRVH